jgi:hypothetical protein
MFVIAAVWLLSPWDLGDEVCPGDLARFPADALLAAEYADMASDHYEWVESHMWSVRGVDWQGWLSTAEHARDAWRCLELAWNTELFRREREPHRWDDWNRSVAERLHALRDVIGPEDYRAGRLPDPIPYRRVMP